ncbi:hypothetical protein H7I87_12510 [Mycobacterium timonense]|uniref:hypothetical protein n=1 Tax=Mycobacterium avium complex (MAC) TaxID=120793 RepID=UPI0013CFAA7E|nr:MULTISPECIES: hypothetical protein [Mycobacterium avium complex (MAC)]MCV6995527.1 hypothetical protein [Mycobacterium timonense]MCV7406707.1 hypothetical protein [Mycobacterium marseillense]
MPIDQPPQSPLQQPVSEVRYAEDQKKQRAKQDEQRKKRQAADMRLKTQQTSQNK